MLLKVHLGIKRLELPVFGLGKERQFDEVAAWAWWGAHLN